jgi:pimeloyl-ACP methyl ester carboxylesterase
MVDRDLKTRHSSAAIVGVLFLAVTALLHAQESDSARAQPATKVTEELVHARTDDGFINGGALFMPPGNSAKSIAILWIHGSTANFYSPTYVKIGRELARRGFAAIAGNTRMHDLGTVAGFQGQRRIRSGAYWGLPSAQTRDLAGWIDFANQRGFQRVVLVGHSAGASAVQNYQAEKQDRRVVAIVLASGRFRPATTAPDSEMLAQAARLVAEGRGEELLRYPNRPNPRL